MNPLNKFRFANIVIGFAFTVPFTATTFEQSGPRPAPTPTPHPIATATEITPPSAVAVKAPPKSVILGPGTQPQNIKAVTVNNPSALPNVATRLRAMLQLAEVMTEDTQVLEVSQGVVLHHFLSYRLKPDVCSDPVRRSALPSSGIRCATQLSDEARAAAFSTCGDPRYFAEPAKRTIVIANAKKASAAEHLRVASDLTKLRASLNNPADRAKVDSLRGAGEAQRLSTLSDDQLKAEIINSGVAKIEQVAFVPTSRRLAERLCHLKKAQIGRSHLEEESNNETPAT